MFLTVFMYVAALLVIICPSSARAAVDPSELRLLRPLVGPPLTQVNNALSNASWGADLGVPLVIPRPFSSISDVLHVFGDVECLCAMRRTPSAQCVVPSNAPRTDNEGATPPEHCHTHPKSNLPVPVHRLLGASTVPGGMLLLPASIRNGTMVSERRVALFMMNVSTWANHTNGFILANGFVLEQKIPAMDYAHFHQTSSARASSQGNQMASPSLSRFPYLTAPKDASPAWSFDTNGPFVNAAPIFDGPSYCNNAAPSSDRKNDDNDCTNTTVYIYFSKTFRFSPIYLARAKNFNDLFDKDKLQFYGGASNKAKKTKAAFGIRSNSKSSFSNDHADDSFWSKNPSHAALVISPSIANGVGEVSVVYLPCYNVYVLSFFTFNSSAHDPSSRLTWKLAKSKTPIGPFQDVLVLMNATTRLPWYQPEWGGPYGGYIYQTDDSDGNKGNVTEPESKTRKKISSGSIHNTSNSSVVRLVLSLWKPYAAGDIEFDLAPHWGSCQGG